MFNRIPEELKSLPQWVLWKYVRRDDKVTKVPYDCKTGYPVDFTDPEKWISFNEATANAPQYDGIGFVLSVDDPYCIIDLDNKPDHPCTPEQLARHSKIYEAFQSYTELSVSGTGVHIVCRGQIPAGVHKDNVECYSDSRYMAFTGNILRDLPITDYQEVLSILYGEMAPPVDNIALVEVESDISDSTLFERASTAANAEKFNALCAGDWQHDYTSQSDADLALLSILCFYTPDNEQVRRLFRMTALGKRDKATKNDTYLNYSLRRIRKNEAPPIDFSQLLLNAQAIMNSKSLPHESAPVEVLPAPVSITPPPAQSPQKVKAVIAPHMDYVIEAAGPAPSTPTDPALTTLPPGLLGELAQYFFTSSVRPIPEACIMSALGLMAGICGRSYNISNTGLNQYLLFLAETGSGKEAVRQGPQRIINSLLTRLPMAGQFIGPTVASGQALYKHLPESPVFVCIMGEFGDTLQRLNDPRANMAEKTTKTALLQLYNSSGWNDCVPATVYSDREKNTEMVRAPAVSIMGEGTAEKFYEGLDLSQVSDGLIPRFMVVEYSGDRPDYQEINHTVPSEDLLLKVKSLIEISMATSNNNSVCQVVQDPKATSLLRDYNRSLDAKHNAGKRHNDPLRNLWNRAHLKALKLSALVAVGINPHSPMVTQAVAEWAIQYVEASIGQLAKRFQTGDIGSGDSKQVAELTRLIMAIVKEPPALLKRDTVAHKMLKQGVIGYSYLQMRTSNLTSFKTDRMGPTAALKKCLQVLDDSGKLVLVPRATLSSKYGYSGAAYGINGKWGD